MITFDKNRFYKIQSSESIPLYPLSEQFAPGNQSPSHIENNINADTLIIPEGYKCLGRLCSLHIKYATQNPCKEIKNLIFPSTMKLIRANAFAGTSIEKIQFNDGLKYIEPSAFHYQSFFYSKIKEIDLPDSVEYIGQQCFANLPYLKKAKLGKNIEIVTFKTFYNCPELEEVILSEGVKLIQKAAFFNCSKLSKINLPQSIQWIEKDAFTGTKINLKDFDFPFLKDGFAVRGENDSIAEYYYGEEEIVTVPSYVKTIGAECFANTNVKKVILGENVETIKPAAFMNTKMLETVVLNKNITLIPKNCFTNSGIKEISGDISGLRCIGNSAFAFSSIKSFQFPQKFETICGFAFRDCRQLTDITFEDDFKDIRGEAFLNCEQLKADFLSKIDLQKVHPSAFTYEKISKDYSFPELIPLFQFAPDTKFKQKEPVSNYRPQKWQTKYSRTYSEDYSNSTSLQKFYDSYEAFRDKRENNSYEIFCNDKLNNSSEGFPASSEGFPASSEDFPDDVPF